MIRKFFYFIKAYKRSWVKVSIPEALDVHVVSPGGVATTMLMQHIAQYKTINDTGDSDGFKHLPIIPRYKNSETKVIFVYGAPNTVYKSIKRRGWLDVQAMKIGAAFSILATGKLKQRLFERAIIKQLSQWKTMGDNCMIIHYECLWEQVYNIAEFLELQNSDFELTFPAKKNRLS